MKVIFTALTLLALAFPAFAEEEFNLCAYHECGDRDDTLTPGKIQDRVHRGIAVAAAADTYVVDPSKDFHLNLNYANGDGDHGAHAVGLSAGYLFEGFYFGGAVATSTNGDVQVYKGTVGFSF